MRIDRENLNIVIGDEPRRLEAYVLDDAVVARRTIDDLHLVVTCTRDVLASRRIERLSREDVDCLA